MALGETHYRWRPDVERVVQRHLARFPRLTANTYVDHPFPGWDGRSVDFWGPGGRGDAIPRELGKLTVRLQLNRPGPPQIRHLIYGRRWWTSWAGWLDWPSDDHSGQLRHVHITFY